MNDFCYSSVQVVQTGKTKEDANKQTLNLFKETTSVQDKQSKQETRQDGITRIGLEMSQ